MTEVTNMKFVFSNLNSFNADISKWNTSAVTDMAFSMSTSPLLFQFVFLPSRSCTHIYPSSFSVLLCCWFNHGLGILLQRFNMLLCSIQIFPNGKPVRSLTCHTVRPLHLFWYLLLLFPNIVFLLIFCFHFLFPLLNHLLHRHSIQHFNWLHRSMQIYPNGIPLV